MPFYLRLTGETSIRTIYLDEYYILVPATLFLHFYFQRRSKKKALRRKELEELLEAQKKLLRLQKQLRIYKFATLSSVGVGIGLKTLLLCRGGDHMEDFKNMLEDLSNRKDFQTVLKKMLGKEENLQESLALVQKLIEVKLMNPVDETSKILTDVAFLNNTALKDIIRKKFSRYAREGIIYITSTSLVYLANEYGTISVLTGSLEFLKYFKFEGDFGITNLVDLVAKIIKSGVVLIVFQNFTLARIVSAAVLLASITQVQEKKFGLNLVPITNVQRIQPQTSGIPEIVVVNLRDPKLRRYECLLPDQQLFNSGCSSNILSPEVINLLKEKNLSSKDIVTYRKAIQVPDSLMLFSDEALIDAVFEWKKNKKLDPTKTQKDQTRASSNRQKSSTARERSRKKGKVVNFGEKVKNSSTKSCEAEISRTRNENVYLRGSKIKMEQELNCIQENGINDIPRGGSVYELPSNRNLKQISRIQLGSGEKLELGTNHLVQRSTSSFSTFQEIPTLSFDPTNSDFIPSSSLNWGSVLILGVLFGKKLKRKSQNYYKDNTFEGFYSLNPYTTYRLVGE